MPKILQDSRGNRITIYDNFESIPNVDEHAAIIIKVKPKRRGNHKRTSICFSPYFHNDGKLWVSESEDDNKDWSYERNSGLMKLSFDELINRIKSRYDNGIAKITTHI